MGEGASNLQRGVLFYNMGFCSIMYVCSEMYTDDTTYRYVHKQHIKNRLEANFSPSTKEELAVAGMSKLVAIIPKS